MSKKLPDTREMITRLIATPSVSCTHARLDMSNSAVIDILANWTEDIGFSLERQSVSPGKYNLIATVGSGSDGLVLSGHTDTVPCDDKLWDSDPFELYEADDRFYGLGSCDMKSFIALAISATQAFDLSKLKRPLTLVATADEESTMNGAKLIADNGRKLGSYCVIGEPTNLTPIRQHKGCMSISIKLLGQSGHASDPSLGNNALEGMNEVMNALLLYRDGLQHQYNDPAFTIPTPTMNLGHIHGGDNSNRICGSCELLVDIRFLPGMSMQTLLSTVQEITHTIADQRKLGFNCQLLGNGVQSMDTTEASEITKYLTAITRKRSGSVAFGTEAPYFNSMKTETIVMGPGSINQAHQPNEFLPIDQIDPTIRLLEGLIQKFCID
jgi:acetylornithine deacetylase